MKTTGKKATRFDNLVAQAAKLLEVARQERHLTDLGVTVRDHASTLVHAFVEEADTEGTLTANGVRLGRKL